MQIFLKSFTAVCERELKRTGADGAVPAPTNSLLGSSKLQMTLLACALEVCALCVRACAWVCVCIWFCMLCLGLPCARMCVCM